MWNRARVLLLCVVCAAAARSADLENYVYTSSGEVPTVAALLKRKDIGGVQVVYPWSLLETSKGHYDFSRIESDLEVVQSLHKKLFVQIQDRFFSPEARNVPKYLLAEPEFGGGLVPQRDNPGENKAPVMGWAAMQWNPHVRERYQNLLEALAQKFDGEVQGINLPETSVDIDMKHDKTGFSCDRYFEAEMENIRFARKVFTKSLVVQYVNFWPCEWSNDHKYMERMFEFAAENGIGLGGPDIVPYQRGQMSNAYPFFEKYKTRLRVVAMAVQEPTLTYRNPKTGKRFTKTEFESFGRDYLGAGIIFWSSSTPWLKSGDSINSAR